MARDLDRGAVGNARVVALAMCAAEVWRESLQAMTDHHTDRCILCGQAGHNSSQCLGARWPRSVAWWFLGLIVCMLLGWLPLWMSKP